MMKKFVCLLALTSLFVSCKAQQKAMPAMEETKVVVNESVANIINNHNAIPNNFKTAYIKSEVDYKDEKQSVSVTADIRIKKDEMILVTVKMFGFTGAKALLTPTEVKYYEKIGGKFFEGDYKTLSNWLGTELNFQKVQNLLLGKAMDTLVESKYALTMEENHPKLEELPMGNFIKTFLFHPTDFTLKQQEIKQMEPSRKMIANYSNYKSSPEAVLPMELAIFAIEGEKTTAIAIQNKQVTFNEELTFPYSVPSGYEQIKITK